MRYRTSLGLLAAASLCILASARFAQAREGSYIAQGYWAWTENPTAEYSRYIRITGDSGYYCFLDGKSSFAFAIVNDSITTPMNGKNAIIWAPGSGDIIITGSEKGEPYTERFAVVDPAAYRGHCGDQDRTAGATALRGNHGRRAAEGKAGARGIFAWQREGYSLSGRRSDPGTMPTRP
jgi:hypothetical protein